MMKQWNMESNVVFSCSYDLQDFDKTMDNLFENDYIQRSSENRNLIELA